MLVVPETIVGVLLTVLLGWVGYIAKTVGNNSKDIVRVETKAETRLNSTDAVINDIKSEISKMHDTIEEQAKETHEINLELLEKITEINISISSMKNN